MQWAKGWAVSTLPVLAASTVSGAGADVWERVEHHTADHEGVAIHYVTLGGGDPVLFVHGFPDFWYTWREQMAVLSEDFQVVAMDLRAYNHSDKPRGVESYRMPLLLGDVMAVIEGLGADTVTLVGHDWGGAIAWRFAMEHPERVKNLIILNLTHPRGYAAVVADPTEEQRRNTEYARRFATSEPRGDPMPDRILAMGERFGPDIAKRYREAFERSYYDGMVNYYRANYEQVAEGAGSELPDIQMPVLQFHGLQDTAVDKAGLRNTWDWIAADYTLVAVPSAGHWVQAEAADLVSQTMRAWLLQRR